jgi:hypothetical protein
MTARLTLAVFLLLAIPIFGAAVPGQAAEAPVAARH